MIQFIINAEKNDFCGKVVFKNKTVFGRNSIRSNISKYCDKILHVFYYNLECIEKINGILIIHYYFHMVKLCVTDYELKMCILLQNFGKATNVLSVLDGDCVSRPSP